MRMQACAAIALAAAFAFSPAAMGAGLCAKWSAAEKIGALDSKILKEASGIAVSRRFPGRLYHNQDSGDGPNFYITDMTGGHTQTVSVPGFTPIDVEDIALGRCRGARSCLYLPDVGDNSENRKSVQIVLVPEKAHYGQTQNPLRIINAKYPDRAHNVEGLAIHPNGDLFLITKSFDLANRRALVAQVFKLTAAQLAHPQAMETFTEVGKIDFPYILYDYGLPGQIVTGMDISNDGTRVLAITYRAALEINLDLSQPMSGDGRTWKPNTDFRIIDTAKLPQAEAIAYSADNQSFFYDSETVTDGAESPLYRSVCTAP